MHKYLITYDLYDMYDLHDLHDLYDLDHDLCPTCEFFKLLRFEVCSGLQPKAQLLWKLREVAELVGEAGPRNMLRRHERLLESVSLWGRSSWDYGQLW